MLLDVLPHLGNDRPRGGCARAHHAAGRAGSPRRSVPDRGVLPRRPRAPDDGAMPWVADVLCSIAGVLLLLLTLPGRPARGEALVGAHLYTGPVALLYGAGVAFALWVAPLPLAAVVSLTAALPLVVVGMTFLPLAAHVRGPVRGVKAAMCAVVAAPFAMTHGAELRASLPIAGAVVVAAVAAVTAWELAAPRLRRLGGRALLRLRGGAREPSEWERGQAEWQRGEWARVPTDAGVPVLLSHARSLAPDVRTACHERLAAHADLDAALAAALRGEAPADALWYLAHHHPRSRAAFAAPVAELLARLRTTWPERLRADPHPRPWTGDLLPALECAVAVLHAGGDVRAELRAWQRELATIPALRGVATELARWLKKAG
jgi:hypothetical protein